MDPLPSASSNTLHEEHVEFETGTEHLRRVADSVGVAPIDELRAELCRAYEELLRRLVPHAMAEDRSPLSQIGCSESERRRCVLDPVMREHLEIERLLVELDGLRWELAHPVMTSVQEQAVRRVLYGLHALLRVHLVAGPAVSANRSPSSPDVRGRGDGPRGRGPPGRYPRVPPSVPSAWGDPSRGGLR